MPTTSLPVLVERFLAYRRAHGYAAGTVCGNRATLASFLRFLDERSIEDVAEITPRLLADYQTATMLQVDPAGRPLGAQTQANKLGHLRTFFRFLVKQGVLLVDPARDLVLPRVPRRAPRDVLDLAAMKRLLSAPDTLSPRGVRDRAILELFYSTGIRVSELVALDVYDVDLVGGEMSVRHGKGRKPRRIPVGELACHWIRRWLEAGRPRLLKRPGERAMFVSWRGRRLHPYNVWKAVATYARKAHIATRVTPHTIRHTFATHLLKGKASLRHIQEMLGHERLTTTQIYTQVDISDLKDVHRRCHPRGRG